MESIKMNYMVNHNSTKNVSMHIDKQQLLDQTNPFDESGNIVIKTGNISPYDSMGTHPIHNLAKFVDDQVSSQNDQRKTTQISVKSTQNNKRSKPNSCTIRIDQVQQEKSITESINETALRLSKNTNAITPRNAQEQGQTVQSINQTTQAHTNSRKVSDKAAINSSHINRRINENQYDKTSQFDDVRSNYSRISKVSKFTSNLMNKSNNQINDQWYQFIYNYDDQCLEDDDDETISFTRSQGGISRFTLNSKLSNAGQSNLSKLSKLQNKYLNQNKAISNKNDKTDRKNKSKQGSAVQEGQIQASGNRQPLEKLNDLLVSIDICRLIRLNWLLGPMINRRTVKSRIFNFLNYQVSLIIEQLDCQIKKAICYYLSDDLIDCMEICKSCRLLYLQQYKKNRKQTQYDSYQMVKVWVIELTCHIELMREDQTTTLQRNTLRQQAHSILEEIPTLVKRRQNQHFTIIELILQYKEKIAYSKLKDLDFISYKLLKLERSINFQNEVGLKGQTGDDISQLFMKEDDDEKKSPQEYCAEIQKQFNRIPTSEQIKKIEYYMYGALCAYRNHHFKEAWNFVSQAPFICNFGEQVPDLETLVVFEMLKMVELKLLTKIGRPEQAIIQISNRFFKNKIIDDDQFNKLFPFSASQQNMLSFDTHIFLDQTWYLYKKIQYTCRLIEFKQEQLKFKMVSCIGEDFNIDATALQKANDDLYNQMYHLLHIMKSLRFYEEKLQFRNRVLQFHWLLIKILLRLDKSGKFQQMISNENFTGIFQRVDIMQVINNLKQKWQKEIFGGLPDGKIAQVSKIKNKNMIECFQKKYGNKPFVKTIQSLQNRLNQKFNKQSQNVANQKKQGNKRKGFGKHKRYDESRIDLSIIQPYSILENENDIFCRSIVEKSNINDSIHYSCPSIHIESEIDMMNKIIKCPNQFFIQLQYITDFVDKKLADINFMGVKDYLNSQEEKESGFDIQIPLNKTIKIKNYFEQLKTEQHQKQTKFIARSLQAFLDSAKMIVFQNLHTAQEFLDYEIKQASKESDNKDFQIQDKNVKSKNLKSKFLEKSKHVLRALETIYINEKFMNLNMEGDQTLNDLNKAPYISEDKSCLNALNGISIIQDSQTIDYSYIENLTNLNFPAQFQETDNISAQNFVTNGLNFNNLKNNNIRTDITEQYSQISDSEYQNNSRFEGGQEESLSQHEHECHSRFEPQNIPVMKQRDSALSKSQQKSLLQKMKVQYFNLTEDQHFDNLDDPYSALKQGNQKNGISVNDNENFVGEIDMEDDNEIEQNELNQGNLNMCALISVPRETDQVKLEEDDFMIQLNKSIAEEKQIDSNSSNKNRNNSRSSTGGKTTKNSKESCFITTKHKKNYSSSFKKDKESPNTKNEAFYNQSPQMTDLIDKLQFGGNEKEANSAMTNKHGRLTFPLNLMQSNQKQMNESYFELEKTNEAINNAANCNEIEEFFDQTSRIAPSQINFNDIDMDLHDNHYESRLSDLNSEDEESDEDDQNLSIDDLIHNQQEKLNYTILNHSVYNENILYKLVMACCLADNHLNLGIRIINILLKIRTQQELLKIKKSVFMNYLEIITAYIYLRLNQKQFQRQQSNLNTSKIIEQNPNISRIIELNQNTPNRLNTDMSTIRLQDISRDENSQINFQNNSSALYGNIGVNNLMDTMTNSLNYGQTINGMTATDISQGHISQHLITPGNSALKQQIMCIIQNQDYFVQQARMHWKKFDVDNFLINFDMTDSNAMRTEVWFNQEAQNKTKMEESTFDPEKSCDVDLHDRLVTVNIITMMLLYVQSELLTYKQIRSYDNFYEIIDIKKLKFTETTNAYQICLSKLTQERKNQMMFSAFKKIEKRDNIVRKSDNKMTDIGGTANKNVDRVDTGLDSISKLNCTNVIKQVQERGWW